MGTQVQGTNGRGKRVAVREMEPEVVSALRDCERRIDLAYDDAWHALKTIHDDKLYKADGYGSFKDYVEQRWGYSKTRAHQLIDHVKIVEYLKEQGVTSLPTSEAHTRPMAKFRRTAKSEENFLQKCGEAWQIASDTAPKQFDVPKVTADHVESTMQHYGLYRTAKAKADTTAADFRTALTRALDVLTECGLDGYKLHEKYDDKIVPNGFRKLVDVLMQLAEVSRVQ